MVLVWRAGGKVAATGAVARWRGLSTGRRSSTASERRQVELRTAVEERGNNRVFAPAEWAETEFCLGPRIDDGERGERERERARRFKRGLLARLVRAAAFLRLLFMDFEDRSAGRQGPFLLSPCTDKVNQP